jgi:hypothetical protein
MLCHFLLKVRINEEYRAILLKKKKRKSFYLFPKLNWLKEIISKKLFLSIINACSNFQLKTNN